jgi:hypothetical protein
MSASWRMGKACARLVSRTEAVELDMGEFSREYVQDSTHGIFIARAGLSNCEN